MREGGHVQSIEVVRKKNKKRFEPNTQIKTPNGGQGKTKKE